MSISEFAITGLITASKNISDSNALKAEVEHEPLHIDQSPILESNLDEHQINGNSDISSCDPLEKQVRCSSPCITDNSTLNGSALINVLDSVISISNNFEADIESHIESHIDECVIPLGMLNTTPNINDTITPDISMINETDPNMPSIKVKESKTNSEGRPATHIFFQNRTYTYLPIAEQKTSAKKSKSKESTVSLIKKVQSKS